MVQEIGFRATGQVYRSRWFDRTVEGPAFVSLRAHAAPLPEHYDSGPSTIFLRDFKVAGPAPSLKSPVLPSSPQLLSAKPILFRKVAKPSGG